MRKVHLVKGHVLYVYWIDTVYVQNNLPASFSHILCKIWEHTYVQTY